MPDKFDPENVHWFTIRRAKPSETGPYVFKCSAPGAYCFPLFEGTRDACIIEAAKRFTLLNDKPIMLDIQP